jgi:hypothetical protein
VTGTPLLDIDGPALIDFGVVTLGTSSPSQTVALFNPGSGLVSIDSITLTDPAFTVRGGSCGHAPIRIAVGRSCTIEFGFAPQVEGPIVAQALFSGSSVTSPDALTLTGEGAPTSVVGFSPTVLDFGDVEPGLQASRTLVVENIGTGALEIDSLVIDGRHGPDFTVQGDGCTGEVLATGESCTLELGYAPQSAGIRSATLVVDSNAAASPDRLPLVGTSDVVFFDGFETDR